MFETTPNFYRATLSTPEEREPYREEIKRLIEKTYESYGTSGGDGNLYGANFDHLVNDPGEWRLGFQGNKIVAGVIYRNFKGRKVRLVLHNDTPAAKAMMINILVKSFEEDGTWAEAGGNLERILRDNHVREIPNTEAAVILEKSIDELLPENRYRRVVFHDAEKNDDVRKDEMLFGRPAISN